MASLKGLYNAVWNNNTTTLILSPTQRQSGNLFRRMKYFLNRNSAMPPEARIPISEMIQRETQTVIELENESVIYSLPATDTGDNIRGFVANMIIIDEAPYIKDEVYKAIRPMIITTRGTLMLLGTPNGSGNYFAKAYNNKNWGFSKHFFPSSISPMIDEAELEKERIALPDTEYRQEYEAEFVESTGVMFTPTEVDECIRKDCPEREGPIKREDYEYVLGYDPARFGEDEGIAMILEKRVGYNELTNKDMADWAAVKIFEIKQMPINEQIKFIEALHRHWAFKRIIVDTTGMGAGITDALEEKRYPVEEFQFSLKSKAEIYFNLKRQFESKNLILPDNKKLRKQLLDLRREQSEKSGFIKIFHPRRGHDDMATALALACWAGTRKKPVEVLFGTSRGVFS